MDDWATDRIAEWQSADFDGGVEGLHGLADRDFSGVVEAGRLWVIMLNGKVLEVDGGALEAIGDAGTVHYAPDESLPLLFAMRGEGSAQDQYYSEDNPIADIDQELQDAGFTGYIELSENVMSGDYFVVYYGGRAFPVAFIGMSERLHTGQEALEKTDDEVGIYDVVPVTISTVDIPGYDGTDEPAGDAPAQADEPQPSPDDADPTTEATDADAAPATDADTGTEPARPESTADGADATTPERSSSDPEPQPSPASDPAPEPDPGPGGDDGTARPAAGTEPADSPSRAEPEPAPSDPAGRDPQRGGPASGGTEAGAGDPGSPGGAAEAAPEPPAEELMTHPSVTVTAVPSLDPARTSDGLLAIEHTGGRGGQHGGRWADADGDDLARLESQIERERERRRELEREVERLQEAIEGETVATGHEAGGDEPPASDDLIAETELFVRYREGSGATIEGAIAGEASIPELEENLRLEPRTAFDQSSVDVAGRSFEEYLEDHLVYRIVEWLTRDLPADLVDDARRTKLADLAEAYRSIDRVGFEQALDDTDHTFDVVARDAQGGPRIAVAIDPDDGATGPALVRSAMEAAKTGGDSLAAVLVVSGGVFDPEAVSIVEDATGNGFLSRSRKAGYVKVGRGRGFHVCLVEYRPEGAHVTFPEL